MHFKKCFDFPSCRAYLQKAYWVLRKLRKHKQKKIDLFNDV